MNLSPRAASMAATVALHAAAIGVLLQLDAVRQPLAQVIPIMVTLITPPKPEPPPPVIEAPKPRPVATRLQAVPKPQPPESPPLVISESPGSATAWVTPAPKPQPAPIAMAPPPVLPPSYDAAYLQNPPPAYPLMSRRRGEQGRVVLHVLVSAAGAAEQVHLRTSSGHERLDQAALEAVRRWRFVPARQGDHAVAAWVLVPVTFALEG